MTDGMETFTARLASFDVPLPMTKGRTSSAKGVKPTAWSYSRPSPAELAHAGFYYKPYDTNRDNTMCFLCDRALDGWEEDDDPITEHLKHSPNCGWAVMMDIQRHTSNPAEIEDPTSPAVVEARRLTFGTSWPHDGRRGWVCQSEKMVEAGWYFCPQEESPDLASCAYCKLSLDGWEPKDDPYEEHYRRSSYCSFFAFAQPPRKNTKKSSRSKKSRVSKSSRLSTQSTMTTASEAPTIDDDAMDESMLSQATVKTTRSTKKPTKSKAKKAKKDDSVEISSQVDVESVDEKPPEPAKPKRATRGKKRTSEEISQNLPTAVEHEMVPNPEPPSKRRTTHIRSSIVQQTTQPTDVPAEPSVLEENLNEELTSPVAPKRGRKGTKKSASSKTRKTSTVSTATKASLRSRVLDDLQLEAAIEADLDCDVHGAEEDTNKQEELADTYTSQPGKLPTTASVAPMRSSHEVDETAHIAQVDGHHSEVEPDVEVVEALPPKAEAQKLTKKKTRKKSKKNTISNEDKPELVMLADSAVVEEKPQDLDVPPQHNSFVSVEIQVPQPELKSDPEMTQGPAPKKAGRKPGGANKGKKTAKTSKVETEPAVTGKNEEPAAPKESRSWASSVKRKSAEIEPYSNDHGEDHQREAIPRQNPRSSQVPPKTAERYSDIPEQQHHAQSLLGSLAHDNTSPQNKMDPPTASRSGPVQESTPSPSPQSSDAENRPPSTRPSASRPPITSPSKIQTIRVPLAASTPTLSPSQRQANTGYVTSSHAWTPVNIEEILLGASDDKENRDLSGALSDMKDILTSPEKKMTVEEWVSWNAKNGEQKLKRECERLVSLFEKEGGRAMRALEGIECME